jgi:hypothetical protein
MRMKSLSVRRLTSLFTAAALVATFAVASVPAAALAAAPPAPYFNGFESAGDAITGVTVDTQAMFDVTRVPSGTGGITSASGSWHATAAADAGSFTRFGGYSSAFPVGGYTTSIDIYLDTAASLIGSDLRFDWSSAISNPAGGHLRDFIFSVGTDGAGGFVMSVSNNAPGWPANPARDPYTITTAGWYTFQHTFRNDAGVLAVDMKVLSGATVLAGWTLSNPSDVMTTTVGGNRYGWLVGNDLPLALDNVTRTGTIIPSCAATGFVRDGINLTAAQIGGSVTGELDATGCNIGAYNPTSVTGATIFGANYFGVVANGVNLSLTNSTIRNIGEAPAFNGAQHGNAIVYINGASGTISGNTVYDYQKNGITVSGKAADGVAEGPKTTALVLNNVVAGEGPIDYIAQNGIQISFGASATVKGNTVSGDNYTPTSYVACGLLLYQAGGVKASGNILFDNERNQCNFGKGGGQLNP